MESYEDRSIHRTTESALQATCQRALDLNVKGFLELLQPASYTRREEMSPIELTTHVYHGLKSSLTSSNQADQYNAGKEGKEVIVYKGDSSSTTDHIQSLSESSLKAPSGYEDNKQQLEMTESVGSHLHKSSTNPKSGFGDNNAQNGIKWMDQLACKLIAIFSQH